MSVIATGRWFYSGTPVSSTNKTDRHDITEILLKVVLNTINQPNQPLIKMGVYLNEGHIFCMFQLCKYILNLMLFFFISDSCPFTKGCFIWISWPDWDSSMEIYTRRHTVCVHCIKCYISYTFIIGKIIDLPFLAKGNLSFCHRLASVVCRPLTFHILIFSSETP